MLFTDLLASSPELYDSLLQASVELPQTPDVPLMLGRQISLRALKEADLVSLCNACDGSARFGESAYSPTRLFGWFENINTVSEIHAILSVREVFFYYSRN